MSDSAVDREEEQDESAAPLTEHLKELRTRLIRSCWAVGIGFAASYSFSSEIFNLLMHPLVKVMPDKSSMIFTGLTEGFFTYLKVAFLTGLMLATPVIFYQIWAFIAPGLYSHERKYVIPFTVLSVFFFTGGAIFGYFLVFPFAFEFFMSFNTEDIVALPSMKEYLAFSTKLLIAFGTAFELPIFIVFLAKFGLVTVEMLTKNRKYVLVGSFIVAALLTPPDVVTQTLMAFPLMLLYELGIIGTRLFVRKKTETSEELST
ncbi:MAG: twin-arginine translocase subunit TatC [Deltaproteobacteria bacterium]|nr:twin-arginine translocase subunit TatC [Deltaproteobacteria bacterium]